MRKVGYACWWLWGAFCWVGWGVFVSMAAWCERRTVEVFGENSYITWEGGGK